MRRVIAYSLYLSFLLAFSQCEKTDIPLPIDSELSAIEQLRVDQLNEIITPIGGPAPNSPIQELEGLDFLADATIIGLGEASHGSAEFFQMKDRLFRYFVEEHNFKAFSFEADFAESLYFEAYVTGASHEDLTDLMTSKMHFWTWRTEEVRDLLEWMRSYNEGKAPEDMIHYYGVDCQIPVYNVDMMIELLEPLDKEFANSLEYSLYPIRNLEYSSTSTLEDDRQPILDAIALLYDGIEVRTDQIIAASSEQQLELIRRLARVIEQCEDVIWAYSRSSGINPRDEYMAENALWVNEYLGEGTQSLVWAHNLHVQKNPQWSAMGAFLKDSIGSKYQVVGFAFSAGSFTAYRPGTGLITNTIDEVPLTGSINQIFHHAKFENYYLQTSDILYGTDLGDWIAENPEMLNVGSVYESNSYPYYHPTDLEDYYDVIIYFDKSTASKIL